MWHYHEHGIVLRLVLAVSNTNFWGDVINNLTQTRLDNSQSEIRKIPPFHGPYYEPGVGTTKASFAKCSVRGKCVIIRKYVSNMRSALFREWSAIGKITERGKLVSNPDHWATLSRDNSYIEATFGLIKSKDFYTMWAICIFRNARLRQSTLPSLV